MKADMLKRSDVKTALDAALAGSRKLKLTFNRDAFVDIYYLLAMRGKAVDMDDFAYMNLWAVASSRRWESVPREVTVSLPASFDASSEDWFLGRMNERALEAIAVA